MKKNAGQSFVGVVCYFTAKDFFIEQKRKTVVLTLSLMYCWAIAKSVSHDGKMAAEKRKHFP